VFRVFRYDGESGTVAPSVDDISPQLSNRPASPSTASASNDGTKYLTSSEATNNVFVETQTSGDTESRQRSDVTTPSLSGVSAAMVNESNSAKDDVLNMSAIRTSVQAPVKRCARCVRCCCLVW